MSNMNVPFIGRNGIGNEVVAALLANEGFNKALEARIGQFSKADTITQSTNILWYDLAPVIQMLYPYRELIPRISRLPRVPANGGNSFHWKRIIGINVNGASSGVSEGNRGARIAISEQDLTAIYKTLGFESSATFEARLGARNLTPEALGLSVQSSLRSLMIDEEKILINGDASLPLGITPTPVLTQGTVTGLAGTFAGNVYVICAALTGMGILGYQPYSSSSNLGGVPGQVTKVNAGNSSDTYGGGSAQPSAEAVLNVTTTNVLTATVTPVNGAFGYAWFLGNTSGGETLAGITPSAQAYFTKYPATTAQPVGNLKVGASYTDNSTDTLVPDGILTQIFGSVTGPSPGQPMATNPNLPNPVTVGDTLAFSNGGSIIYTLRNGNAGLTVQGVNIEEVDAVLRGAYDQYKVGFSRILVSSVDMLDVFGAMLSQAAASNIWRIMFENNPDGKIVAGYKVTSYLNKFFGNTLDVELHPYVPPGCMVFWSDRSPYELSGVANLLEARVRQDYYQIQWPWTRRAYEYGVYVDETFPCYFTPAFAAIVNKNPSTGNFAF